MEDHVTPLTVLERLDKTLRETWQRHAPEDIKPWFPVDKEEAEERPTRWKVRSTLDIYARFSLFHPMRFRVKHTLKPLRFVSLKSETTTFVGVPHQPDIGLELKLLGALKFRLTRAGSEAQLRVRAPLAYDKAEVDVVYERRYGGGEGVRVAFRFREAAHAKVPGLSAGIKFHNRLHPRVKTTLRVKRGLSRSFLAVANAQLFAEEERDRDIISIPTTQNRPTVLERISAILSGNPIPRQCREQDLRRPLVNSDRNAIANRNLRGNTLERDKSLFDATRDVLTNVLEVEDLGLDVKYRWIDQGTE